MPGHTCGERFSFLLSPSLPSMLLLLVCNVACRPQSTSKEGAETRLGQGKPQVYVVNYPLQYFASRIAGDLVDIEFPAPADVDPAFWNPDDATVAKFQKADLTLLNGAGYAKWVQRVSLPTSRLVDTSRPFLDDLILVDDGIVHSHGPGGNHSHRGFAFTTWIDPRLALQQADQIHRALIQLVPDQKAALDQNYQQLKTDLEQLDQQLKLIAVRYQGEPLLSSHPVYQYLARRCGWKLQSLHWEPSEIPTAEQWTSFVTLLESHPAKWILWEAAPRQETVDRLAELGVTSVVFDPCGNRQVDDYLQVMKDNLQRLETIFPP